MCHLGRSALAAFGTARVVLATLAICALLTLSPFVTAFGQEPPAEPLQGGLPLDGPDLVPPPPPVDVPPVEVPPVDAPAAPELPLNPRYGVVYTRALPEGDVARFQREFGAGAWLDMRADASPIPGKVPLVPLDPQHRPSGEALTALVAQHPAGTAWYLGGEANVPTQGNTTGAEYAPYFHEAAATIRAADPTARIMAASVLNFVDTCRGCAGYTPGRTWIEEFRASYLALYGEEPAVDIWALDSYLLDWNKLPMIDATFLPRQVAGLREYLDAIPGQAGKPIWVTEFGVVWAYEALRWVEQDNGVVGIVPARAFRGDLLQAWLDETVGWLETEGVRLGVERWFLFGTSTPPGEPWYTGIELLEQDELGPRLSRFGTQYAAYARASLPPASSFAALVAETSAPAAAAGGG